MKTYTLVLTVALSILVIQLASIEVHVPVSTFEYGTLKDRVKERVNYFSSLIQSTSYSAMQNVEHDSMIFTGDVMLARNVEVLMDSQGLDYPYQGLVLTALAQNPAIVGNFEASMNTAHTPTPAYQMKFSVRVDTLSALAEAGFSHVSLANNHSLDYGIDGYKNATARLLENNIAPFGHGAIINQNSISYIDTPRGIVALVGINASGNIPTKQDIKNVLTKADEESDLQIIYIHWGIEYDDVHNKTQKLLAHELVSAGADLIVGHHPHVVQDIDIVDGVIVFYSLGNYIFDQYFSEEVKEGLVLSLDMMGEAGVYLLPIESKNPLSQPKQMTPENHALFLQNLAKRSHPSLKNSIEKGYIPLGDAVATSSKMAMMVR
ncbi:MAG: CapA family protein [Candidatus Pacebacteria bacterium]|nr:CapA family protein [Candidatus Paceibacterota bacterium]MBP9843172.1 CapA family protein [Candidatus Paceibacterota bacterium]